MRRVYGRGVGGEMGPTLRTVLGSPAFRAEVRPRVDPLRS